MRSGEERRPHSSGNGLDPDGASPGGLTGLVGVGFPSAPVKGQTTVAASVMATVRLTVSNPRMTRFYTGGCGSAPGLLGHVVWAESGARCRGHRAGAMGAPVHSVRRWCLSSWRKLRPACPRPVHTQASGRETHFGFQTVPEEEKGERVYHVFESVAKKYDLMNDSMSLGIHRLWKDWLLRHMNPTPGTHLLDVAGGTGDVAFRFINYIQAQRERLNRNRLHKNQDLSWSDISRSYSQEQEDSLMGSKAVICDINKEMLKVGKEKSLRLGYSEGLSWVAGDAEELPFADEKFDVYTIAFGIRNVTHIEKALEEAYRVLKPGGRFLCLEFSQVNNPLLARLYDLYSFQVIPVLGEVIAGDWKSYQYLVESIRRFPPQEEFKAMIEDSGFFKVTYHNWTSGVVAVHSGFKL